MEGGSGFETRFVHLAAAKEEMGHEQRLQEAFLNWQALPQSLRAPQISCSI